MILHIIFLTHNNYSKGTFNFNAFAFFLFFFCTRRWATKQAATVLIHLRNNNNFLISWRGFHPLFCSNPPAGHGLALNCIPGFCAIVVVCWHTNIHPLFVRTFLSFVESSFHSLLGPKIVWNLNKSEFWKSLFKKFYVLLFISRKKLIYCLSSLIKSCRMCPKMFLFVCVIKSTHPHTANVTHTRIGSHIITHILMKCTFFRVRITKKKKKQLVGELRNQPPASPLWFVSKTNEMETWWRMSHTVGWMFWHSFCSSDYYHSPRKRLFTTLVNIKIFALGGRECFNAFSGIWISRK